MSPVKCHGCDAALEPVHHRKLARQDALDHRAATLDEIGVTVPEELTHRDAQHEPLCGSVVPPAHRGPDTERPHADDEVAGAGHQLSPPRRGAWVRLVDGPADAEKDAGDRSRSAVFALLTSSPRIGRKY